MGKALYRKYRSHSLDDIVGQSHITELLKRAISSGNIAHAYLLTGPRGVGKTSIARILAHEINGLPYSDEATHLDIIEIDAASNNSVEDIRDLRDKVMIAPTIASRKIYIIDEVHMLSKSAFNALLKTLEEPPAHVVFILATTDADKLPSTILSRVQRFNFKAINPDDAVVHLRYIADTENIKISDDALKLIAKIGHGSFRDSIGLLDQLRSLTDEQINPELIQKTVGITSHDTIRDLLNAYNNQNIEQINEIIKNAEAEGVDASTLAGQLISEVRVDIASNPNLLKLLDKLLDINRSSWPFIKLLVALTSFYEQKPINSPAKLAITKPKAPMPKSTPTTISDKEPAPTQIVKPPKATKPKPPKQSDTTPTLSSLKEFPWQEFLTSFKETATGAYAIMSRCGHEFSDNKLVIYAGNTFNKRVLDKLAPKFHESLSSMGINDIEINITSKNLPPKNSQVADILDIMGGGEEVSL